MPLEMFATQALSMSLYSSNALSVKSGVGSIPLARTIKAGLRQLTLASALALASVAGAQNMSENDSTVVYPADYFDQWVPITALDMLDRIPGQESTGPGGGGGGNPASGGRGLGSGAGGTEILVNGKRTAGKNNQAASLLDRITADQVREIQIIRGTSGELDVRGSAQVVNVVLFEELASNNISYEVRGEYINDDTLNTGASASLSGQRGNLNYLLNIATGPRYQNTHINESSVLGDFSPNDTVIEERTRDVTNNQVSMNLGYDLSANSSVRLNGLYETNKGETAVDRVTTDLKTEPLGLLVEREAIPSESSNWELGGDYELVFNNGDRFKVLAIANQEDRDSVRERYQRFGDDSEQKNLFLGTGSITQERIIRGSYTSDLFGDQSVEFGVERAQTILDSSLALGVLSSTGTPSDEVGGLVPVNVANANSKVEEIRYEPFAIHNWELNSKTTLESTLVYETSQITQTGDSFNQRDFQFIKPKVDLRYNVTPSIQLRGTLERIVNQLSFSDFVASNDQTDEDANVVAGNVDLRQQTQWRYSLNGEYRLPNDIGVVTSELYYADHQDVIDWKPVDTDDGSLLSVNGNIGDGTEYGLNLNASIRMAMIGLPNLLVSPSLNVQDSSVTDPFLGIKRRFRNDARGRFTLTFRHDIPQYRLNWGAQYFDRIDGNMWQYDIQDIEFSVGEPRMNLFAEYVDRRGLTYRLDLANLSDNAQCRERFRYVGPITSGILEELEYRCTNSGMEFQFRVNGTF